VGATTARRARLLALPVFTLLIVAVVYGAAARAGGAGPSSTDEQASIVATTVIVTLLGLSMVAFLLVAIWHMLTGERRRGPAQEQPPALGLKYQLIGGAIVITIFALLVLLFAEFAHRHAPTVAGGALRSQSHAYPNTHPLPYSVAAGAWTTAAFAALVAAVFVYPRARRRLLRRGQKPFADLSGLSAPEPLVDATAMRQPLAAVVVADPRTEPDPRRAVMAAWMAMTDVIGRLWRPRQDSEAPQEYVNEALLEAGVGSGSAARLTNLFEFARWGGRQVGEEMRAEAIAALEAVRAELRDAS
jgi:hypothetical protein